MRPELRREPEAGVAQVGVEVREVVPARHEERREQRREHDDRDDPAPPGQAAELEREPGERDRVPGQQERQVALGREVLG